METASIQKEPATLKRFFRKEEDTRGRKELTSVPAVTLARFHEVCQGIEADLCSVTSECLKKYPAVRSLSERGVTHVNHYREQREFLYRTGEVPISRSSGEKPLADTSPPFPTWDLLSVLGAIAHEQYNTPALQRARLSALSAIQRLLGVWQQQQQALFQAVQYTQPAAQSVSPQLGFSRDVICTGEQLQVIFQMLRDSSGVALFRHTKEPSDNLSNKREEDMYTVWDTVLEESSITSTTFKRTGMCFSGVSSAELEQLQLKVLQIVLSLFSVGTPLFTVSVSTPLLEKQVEQQERGFLTDSFLAFFSLTPEIERSVFPIAIAASARGFQLFAMLSLLYSRSTSVVVKHTALAGLSQFVRFLADSCYHLCQAAKKSSSTGTASLDFSSSLNAVFFVTQAVLLKLCAIASLAASSDAVTVIRSPATANCVNHCKPADRGSAPSDVVLALELITTMLDTAPSLFRKVEGPFSSVLQQFVEPLLLRTMASESSTFDIVKWTLRLIHSYFTVVLAASKCAPNRFLEDGEQQFGTVPDPRDVTRPELPLAKHYLPPSEVSRLASTLLPQLATYLSTQTVSWKRSLCFAFFRSFFLRSDIVCCLESDVLAALVSSISTTVHELCFTIRELDDLSSWGNETSCADTVAEESVPEWWCGPLMRLTPAVLSQLENHRFPLQESGSVNDVSSCSLIHLLPASTATTLWAAQASLCITPETEVPSQGETAATTPSGADLSSSMDLSFAVEEPTIPTTAAFIRKALECLSAAVMTLLQYMYQSLDLPIVLLHDMLLDDPDIVLASNSPSLVVMRSTGRIMYFPFPRPLTRQQATVEVCLDSLWASQVSALSTVMTIKGFPLVSSVFPLVVETFVSLITLLSVFQVTTGLHSALCAVARFACSAEPPLRSLAAATIPTASAAARKGASLPLDTPSFAGVDRATIDSSPSGDSSLSERHGQRGGLLPWTVLDAHRSLCWKCILYTAQHLATTLDATHWLVIVGSLEFLNSTSTISVPRLDTNGGTSGGNSPMLDFTLAAADTDNDYVCTPASPHVNCRHYTTSPDLPFTQRKSATQQFVHGCRPATPLETSAASIFERCVHVCMTRASFQPLLHSLARRLIDLSGVPFRCPDGELSGGDCTTCWAQDGKLTLMLARVAGSAPFYKDLVTLDTSAITSLRPNYDTGPKAAASHKQLAERRYELRCLQLDFCLQQFTTVVLKNLHRLDTITDLLLICEAFGCVMASSADDFGCSRYRLQAVDSLRRVAWQLVAFKSTAANGTTSANHDSTEDATDALSTTAPAPSQNGSATTVPVNMDQTMSQSVAFAELLDGFVRADDLTVQRAVLESVYTILCSNGSRIVAPLPWTIISLFVGVSTAQSCSKRDTALPMEPKALRSTRSVSVLSAKVVDDCMPCSEAPRSLPLVTTMASWGSGQDNILFKLLEVLVLEFRDRILEPAAVSLIASSLSAVVSSCECGDNASFASVGLLWTLGDSLTRRSAATPQDARPATFTAQRDPTALQDRSGRSWFSSVPTLTVMINSGTETTHIRLSLEASAVSSAELDDVVMAIFQQFRRLALDPRVEVRNCSLRSLVSAYLSTTQNSNLHQGAFKRNVGGILVSTLADVSALYKRLGPSSQAPVHFSRSESASADHALQHHSRDTTLKLWDESLSIIFDGVLVVLKDFLAIVETASAVDTVDRVKEFVVHAAAVARDLPEFILFPAPSTCDDSSVDAMIVCLTFIITMAAKFDGDSDWLHVVCEPFDELFVRFVSRLWELHPLPVRIVELLNEAVKKLSGSSLFNTVSASSTTQMNSSRGDARRSRRFAACVQMLLTLATLCSHTGKEPLICTDSDSHPFHKDPTLRKGSDDVDGSGRLPETGCSGAYPSPTTASRLSPSEMETAVGYSAEPHHPPSTQLAEALLRHLTGSHLSFGASCPTYATWTLYTSPLLVRLPILDAPKDLLPDPSVWRARMKHQLSRHVHNPQRGRPGEFHLPPSPLAWRKNVAVTRGLSSATEAGNTAEQTVPSDPLKATENLLGPSQNVPVLTFFSTVQRLYLTPQGFVGSAATVLSAPSSDTTTPHNFCGPSPQLPSVFNPTTPFASSFAVFDDDYPLPPSWLSAEVLGLSTADGHGIVAEVLPQSVKLHRRQYLSRRPCFTVDACCETLEGFLPWGQLLLDNPPLWVHLLDQCFFALLEPSYTCTHLGRVLLTIRGINCITRILRRSFVHLVYTDYLCASDAVWSAVTAGIFLFASRLAVTIHLRPEFMKLGLHSFAAEALLQLVMDTGSLIRGSMCSASFSIPAVDVLYATLSAMLRALHELWDTGRTRARICAPPNTVVSGEFDDAVLYILRTFLGVQNDAFRCTWLQRVPLPLYSTLISLVDQLFTAGARIGFHDLSQMSMITMFDVCDTLSRMTVTEPNLLPRLRLATQCLLNRLRVLLTRFVIDDTQSGQCPLPRHRLAEILLVLDKLQSLRVPPETVTVPLSLPDEQAASCHPQGPSSCATKPPSPAATPPVGIIEQTDKNLIILLLPELVELIATKDGTIRKKLISLLNEIVPVVLPPGRNVEHTA